ncbi:MAG TPA: hypothetical protein VHB25_08205 [Gemmatimonadaceae bacterium]|nr:hypothetical protein [Gemmatimonadaceae bacterium]
MHPRLEILEGLGVARERADDRRVDLGDLIARCLDPALLERVVGEPRVESRRLALALGEELLEHLRHAVRVDSGAHHLVDAGRVRLGFVVAAEFGKHRVATDVDGRLAQPAVADAREHAGDCEAHVRPLHLLHLLHGVAQHHVADLVRHDRRQLVHAIRPFHDTAVDVHEAAGERERVEVVRVHHVEVPVEVGARRDVRDRIAQDVQVAIDVGILDDRQLLVDLLRLLRADLHFLLLRDSTPRRQPQHRGHCRARNESSHSRCRPHIVSWSSRRQDIFPPQLNTPCPSC